MKLARVEHWRCGEPIGWKGTPGSTYVWVPEDMNEEVFEDICEKARKAYLDTEAEFKKLAPVSPPGYGGSIQGWPDIATVADIRADYAKKEKAYKEYHEKGSAARKPFSWHLQQAHSGIKLFHEVKPEIDIELSWGHAHGTTLELGATQISDYPIPTDEDEL